VLRPGIMDELPETPLVGVIMGSKSDLEILTPAAEILRELGVPHELRVVSAHRTPDLLFDYAETAAARGLKCIVAGAGGAAHLPGMLAAKTRVPILGVPVQSRALQGLDSLLSIVQMPKGIPVATFAIGEAGAANAALFAAAMLATRYPIVRARLKAYRAARTAEVLAQELPLMSAILPGATIGILGGGQLGRMTAMAARSLGYHIHTLDPDASCAARFVVERCLTASFDDDFAAADLARHCAVVTLEIEKIALKSLARRGPLRARAPGRGHPRHRARSGAPEGLAVPARLPAGALPHGQERNRPEKGRGRAGRPLLRESDTRGLRRTRPGRAHLGRPGAEHLARARRRPGGDRACGGARCGAQRARGAAPERRRGGLPGRAEPPRRSDPRVVRAARAPCPPTSPRSPRRSRGIWRAASPSRGCSWWSCSLTQDGELLVNEMAPRPHNTFHATEVGSATSQFEQIVRAICDLPLGSVETVRPAAILNLLGDLWLGDAPPRFDLALAEEGVRVHLYGKRVARPGRKMGHLSAIGATPEEAVARVKRARERLVPPP
jgi:5-(carboxyamino)imidazole ribonucleotide synthase